MMKLYMGEYKTFDNEESEYTLPTNHFESDLCTGEDVKYSFMEMLVSNKDYPDIRSFSNKLVTSLEKLGYGDFYMTFAFYGPDLPEDEEEDESLIGYFDRSAVFEDNRSYAPYPNTYLSEIAPIIGNEIQFDELNAYIFAFGNILNF
jgi:hypothetical protein